MTKEEKRFTVSDEMDGFPKMPINTGFSNKIVLKFIERTSPLPICRTSSNGNIVRLIGVSEVSGEQEENLPNHVGLVIWDYEKREKHYLEFSRESFKTYNIDEGEGAKRR